MASYLLTPWLYVKLHNDAMVQISGERGTFQMFPYNLFKNSVLDIKPALWSYGIRYNYSVVSE